MYLYNVPCFSQASSVIDALHGREMAAGDTLRCLHHPLQGLTISSRAAIIPVFAVFLPNFLSLLKKYSRLWAVLTAESACMDKVIHDVHTEEF